MRDKGRIYLGLLAFLVLATIPIWYNVARSPQTDPPELVYPEGETSCVAETDWMRREHMQLVMDWRDEVVRDDDRIFTTDDGRQFYKSLTTTCLDCHDDKTRFCDGCHEYLSVKPYCWECHVIPEGGQ